MNNAILIMGSDSALVDNLPPTEGTDFLWKFNTLGHETRAVAISNPNDVPMTIVWTQFAPPPAYFTIVDLTFVIPAHGSFNCRCHCDPSNTTHTTVGTYETSGSGGAQAITGEADST